jgi:hypothetical protein
MTPSFADRGVFVIGLPRSGTTWLTQLLLANRAAVGLDPGESRMFVALRHLWRNHGRDDGAGIAALIDGDDLAAAMRRYCDGLFAAARAMQHRPGATHFVEKTPAHLFHLPSIRRVYPDAWIVHLVRDARAVVRSLAELEFGQPDVLRGASSWARGERLIDRGTDGMERCRHVRYEDLIADPIGMTADLMGWVGLPVDGAVRAAIAERAGVRVAQFDDARVSSSPRVLDERELAGVLMLAGDELVRLGYVTVAEVAAIRQTPAARQLRRSQARRRLARFPWRSRSS